MSHCPDSHHIQDYLDDELVPAQREAFDAHLATCSHCAAELALYRQVFADLESLPLLEPSADLADRVLAEVMPAHASRWPKLALWGYGGAVAASIAAISAAAFLPGPRQWTYDLVADATRSLVGSLLFVLKSLNAAALRVVDVLHIGLALLGKAGPLVRALRLPLSQPAVAAIVLSAVLVCVAMLWWMRPREKRAAPGDHHVGLLGL
ncbi:MAG: zf-HC2 domain-containing protein [Candidatus Eisenbacteria bacterium]